MHNETSFFLPRYHSTILKDALSHFQKYISSSSSQKGSHLPFALEVLDFQKKNASFLRLLSNDMSTSEVSIFFSELKEKYLPSKDNNNIICRHVLVMARSLLPKSENAIKEMVLNCATAFIYDYCLFPISIEKSENWISEFLIDIAKTNSNLVPFLIDEVVELMLESHQNFDKIWSVFDPLLLYIISNQFMEESFESVTQDLSVNSDADASNKSSLQMLKNAQNIESFMLKSYFVKSLSKLCYFYLNHELLENSLTIFERLMSCAPIFDLYTNLSERHYASLKPFEEILDLFFVLLETPVLKSRYEKSISHFTFQIISHIFSLLHELEQQKNYKDASWLLILQMLSKVLHFVPEYFVPFLPLLCYHVINASTIEQCRFVFSVLSDLVLFLSNALQRSIKLMGTTPEYFLFSLFIARVSILFTQAHRNESMVKLATLLRIIKAMHAQILHIQVIKFSVLEVPNIELYLRYDLPHILSSLENFTQAAFEYPMVQEDIFYNYSPKSSLRQWLSKILQRLSDLQSPRSFQYPSKVQTHILLLVLGATLCALQNHAYQAYLLRLLPKCHNVDSTLCGLLFQPIILNLLSQSADPKTTLTFLYLLPKIGVQGNSKIVVGNVIRLAQYLATSNEHSPLGIKILLILWKENDKCFSVLRELIIKCSKYGKSSVTAFSYNSRMMIATAIHEVCLLNPARGLRLVSILSQLLCQENDPKILCRGLRSMKLLCDAELLDFFTAYFYVIRENIEKIIPKSEDVDIANCELFSCAKREYYLPNEDESFILQKGYNDDDLEFESDYKDEITKIINYLIDRAFSTNHILAATAINSIAQFPLPAILHALQVNETDNSDLITKRDKGIALLTEKVIQMIQLHQGNPNTLEKFTPLLQRIMKIDMKRNNAFQGVATSPSYNNAFTMIKDYLRFATEKKKTEKNIILYNYLWYSSKTDSLQDFEYRMKELIFSTNLSESSTLGIPTHFLFYIGVSRFMKMFYSAAFQFYEGDAKNDSRIAHRRAFQHIFDILQQYLFQKHSSSYSLIFLGALCQEIPPQLHIQVNTIIECIDKNCTEGDDVALSEWQYLNQYYALTAVSYQRRLTSSTSNVILQLEESLSHSLRGILSGKSSTHNQDISLCLLLANSMRSEVSENSSLSQGEKQKVLNISNIIFQFCFPHKSLFEVNSNNTNSSNCDEFLIASQLSSCQVTSLFLSLGSVCKTLSICKEFGTLQNIYSTILSSIHRYSKNLKPLRRKNEANVDEMAKLLQAILFSLPLIMSEIHKNDEITVLENLELVKQINQITEEETTSLHQVVHISSCFAYGTMLRMFLDWKLKSKEDWIHNVEQCCRIINSNSFDFMKLGSIITLLGLLGNDFNSSTILESNSQKEHPIVVQFPEKSHILSHAIATCQGFVLNSSNNASYRTFTALSLGAISEIYGKASTMELGTLVKAQITLDSISTDCISYYLLQAIKTFDLTNINIFHIGIRLWSASSRRPQIQYSFIIQEVINHIFQISNTKQSVDILSHCFELILQDAQEGGTASLRYLLELCSEKSLSSLHPLVLDYIIENCIQLLETFPRSRCLKFIDDLWKIIFSKGKTRLQLLLLQGLQKIPKKNLAIEVTTYVVTYLQNLRISFQPVFKYTDSRIQLHLPTYLLLRECAKLIVSPNFFDKSIFKKDKVEINDILILAFIMQVDASYFSTYFTGMYELCKSNPHLIEVFGSIIFDLLLQMERKDRCKCIETILTFSSQLNFDSSTENWPLEMSLLFFAQGTYKYPSYFLNRLFGVGFFSELQKISFKKLEMVENLTICSTLKRVDRNTDLLFSLLDSDLNEKCVYRFIDSLISIKSESLQKYVLFPFSLHMKLKDVWQDRVLSYYSQFNIGATKLAM